MQARWWEEPVRKMCRLLAIAIAGIGLIAVGLSTPAAIRDTPWSTGIIGALGILWGAQLLIRPRNRPNLMADKRRRRTTWQANYAAQMPNQPANHAPDQLSKAPIGADSTAVRPGK